MLLAGTSFQQLVWLVVLVEPRGDNPISPEKSLLSRYERTAPPRNPRAPTPIDPKEEEARKAVETIPVKAMFKDQIPGKDKTLGISVISTPVDKVYPTSWIYQKDERGWGRRPAEMLIRIFHELHFNWAT